jgi:hypothetical protein
MSHFQMKKNQKSELGTRQSELGTRHSELGTRNSSEGCLGNPNEKVVFLPFLYQNILSI